MEASNKTGLKDFDESIHSQSLEEIIHNEREDFIKQVCSTTSLAALVVAAFNISVAFPVLNLFLILAVFLFWLSRSDLSLNKKSALLIGGYFLVAVFHLLFLGMDSPAAIYLVLVGVLAVILYSTYTGITIGFICLLTWVITGLFYYYTGLVPMLAESGHTVGNWLAGAANMALVFIALIQSRLTSYEILNYAINTANEKRELQSTRSDLLIKQKSLDYERYLLHVLMDNVSDRIFFKDINGNYTRVSKALARQFGIGHDNMTGKTDSDFFTPEYARQIKSVEEDMLRTNLPVIDKIEHEKWADGRPDTWSITNRILLRDPEGKLLGWFGTSRNITDIKKAQQTAQRYAHQLATISEVSRAVTSTIILGDLLDNLVHLLRRSFDYYAVNVWLKNDTNDTLKLENSSTAEGLNLDLSNIAIPLEQRSIITSVYKTGRYRLVYDVENDAPDYYSLPYFPHTRSKVVLPLRMGEKTFGVLDIHSNKLDTFVYNDVLLLQTLSDQVAVSIENARLFAKVEYLATNDTLSGLYNRRYLFELARIEIERSSRYNCPLSVVIMDIDYFKRVNDTYGHPVGDQIIQTIGDVCRKSLRAVDIVGRYGGEEFVFLLPETDAKHAEMVMDRLRRKIAAMPFETSAGGVHITVSMGISFIEPGVNDIGYLLDAADKALYRAKQTGRNKVVIYDKSEFITQTNENV
ncbi:MAG: diguanylate cyclase [Anaerolineae bacterium]|nr:diguanylate cyclase [Anaerolineae bacterium]